MSKRTTCTCAKLLHGQVMSLSSLSPLYSSSPGATMQLPILTHLAASNAAADAQEDLVSTETDVGMPPLGDIVTTYSISDTITPLTSLTTLTTNSTLDSVLNEPIMTVAIAEVGSDISLLS